MPPNYTPSIPRVYRFLAGIPFYGETSHVAKTNQWTFDDLSNIKITASDTNH